MSDAYSELLLKSCGISVEVASQWYSAEENFIESAQETVRKKNKCFTEEENVLLHFKQPFLASPGSRRAECDRRCLVRSGMHAR